MEALFVKDITVLQKFFIFCVLVTLLGGCNEDDIPTISLEDFEQEVINVAGTQAFDCGKVEINESPLAVNTCVSDSFIINQSFYSFYIAQGIDSTVAYAISMAANGVVLYWSYDSFDGGKITSIVCKEPSATSELTGAHTDVINCTE